jgi:putative oxidoreductase
MDTKLRRLLRIAREVALWALTGLLVWVFTRAGWDKFDDASGWAKAFVFWGYPVWFRILIGVVEVGAALLLLWPRTAAYGAAAIILVMLGGMGTHIFVEHRPSRVTSELGQLLFASLVLAGRWRARIRPWAR